MLRTVEAPLKKTGKARSTKLEVEHRIRRSAGTTKVSDYVISFIARLGVRHVFMLPGGGCMHLVDSIGRSKDLRYICTLHEQAAAIAAESYARVTNHLGTAVVTSGPGGTNAITGVAGAWTESTPCIFISGQVKLEDTVAGQKIRQMGIQELNIVDIVKPITKYAVMVTSPETIRYHLEKATFLARHGRSGPVWLDIPLDVQGAMVDESTLVPFDPSEERTESENGLLRQQIDAVVESIKIAKRPVILAGNGIRLARGEKEFLELAEILQVPVLTTWNGIDLIPGDHDLFMGRPNIFGQRASNFIIQNADLLLSIGARLGLQQTGFNHKAFAREAVKIIVDVDSGELCKKNIEPDLAVCSDAKVFVKELIARLTGHVLPRWREWKARCREWNEIYPVLLPRHWNGNDFVNSYVFIDVLSDELSSTDVVVPGSSGTALTCTMQTFKVKQGQRVFANHGFASMGWALPSSIGACLGSGKRRTICIDGDGSIEQNVQELQTICSYRLPIKIFVLSNEGYLAIRTTQKTHFGGHFVGSGPTSGLTLPNICRVAKAYGLKTMRVRHHLDLREKIRSVLTMEGPVLCEIMMSPEQTLYPKLASQVKPDGRIVSKPLEDLYPFLDRDEFRKNMIVKPLEE